MPVPMRSSRLAVGSSRSRSSGSSASARAIRTRWSCPPESAPIGTLGEVGDLHRGERPRGGLAVPGRERPQHALAPQPTHADDVLHPDREIGVEARPLRDVAHAPAGPDRRLAEHADRPARRRQEAEHDAQKRRLAPAVRPEERQVVAGLDHEVDGLEHGKVPVREPDVPQLDRRRTHFGRTLRRRMPRRGACRPVGVEGIDRHDARADLPRQERGHVVRKPGWTTSTRAPAGARPRASLERARVGLLVLALDGCCCRP